MKQPPRFAIIYGDGTIYEGGGKDDEWVEITVRYSRDWLDAPLENVQAIVEENPYTNRRIWRAKDFYYVMPDTNEICNTDQIGNYLRGYAPWIKHGLTIPNTKYEDAMQAAMKYKGITPDGPRRPNPEKGLDD